MSNENTPSTADPRPAVGGPVQRQVRPAVAVAHGSDEHLTLIGAPWHWNLLHGVDRADMLAFGRACMEAERERCALLCLSRSANGNYRADTRDDCAALIRGEMD